MRTLKNEYFGWLCDLVGIDNRRGQSYWLLADRLFRKEFYGMLGNDEDRGSEGKYLRFIFAKEVYPGHEAEVIDELEGACSVFEMLIGFSRRIADWLCGSPDDPEFKKWFFQMIRNLGLEEFTDSCYMGIDNPNEEVNRRLDIFLERSYDRYGNGGLFPLKNPDRDQRKEELWYQLNHYLRENPDLWMDN